MRKILIIILMLMVLPCFAARKQKPPVKYLQFEPNVQTKQVCYKVEDFEEKDGVLYFYFEESLSDMLFTERLVEDVYDALRRSLPSRYKKRSIKIISKNYPIEEFVPNHRRIAMKTDSARIGKPFAPHNVVSRLSLPYPAPDSGLYGRNIVLWPSHGLYFNAAKDRWEWQRPRLFGTVEDLMSVDVCLNYLLPMLRNAGAEVFMPRERDIRTETADFAIERTEDSLHCTLKVPKAGYYWLKMWYTTDGNPSSEVKFSVSRNGIKTEYAVNGGVGNGTWIYVDKLYFDGEARADFAIGDGGGFCLDTLRIGGGFSASGNGMPAYVDGARYFLQASNVPDSILYCGKEGRIGDYYDDLYSRARWVNHLAGGSPVFPGRPGLQVPLDACLALHTDASQTADSGYEGSLVVCTADSLFPDGQSRLASNDLAYYVTEQIASDFGVADSLWAMRGIWHRLYVETRVPQIPVNIIEMWSHNNFEDVQRALDPRFRFRMARAVYKAVLKFLAEGNGRGYCVQPLPVSGFTALLAGDSARLSWRPVRDSHESTATPDAYVVYTRVGNGGFDNGVFVTDTAVCLPVVPDSIYSYKITAVNAGGESFPSEILSLCNVSDAKGTALVVNCFDRVGGPECFQTDSLAGFLYGRDFGVPYIRDLSYSGPQYEFRTVSCYAGNDYPGFGASMADSNEGMCIAGNTFDYPYVHGKALAANGYSFVSCSKQALEEMSVDLSSYPLMDVILGLQRTRDGFELLTPPLQDAVYAYLKSGRKLVISGAYVASDGGKFVRDVLRCKLRAPWEARDGRIESTSGDLSFSLCNRAGKDNYFVQSVESLSPVGKGGEVRLLYSQSRNPAAIRYKGHYEVTTLGFPFEAVIGDEARAALMQVLVAD